MKKAVAFLVVCTLCAVSSVAYALYSVHDKGDWPKNWPAELEPLRKQAHTFVGPMTAHRHYAIPFTNRSQVELAWPHILKVKSKGAPIFLVRSPSFFLGENT